MASIPTFTSSYSLPKPNTLSLSSSHHNNNCNFPLTSLFGTKLTLHRPLSSPSSFLNTTNCRAASPTVSSSPPTSDLQPAEPVKTPKWSARAIRSCELAATEARKLKYPNIGTETLLMGILVEGTSKAAKFLRANGITSSKVCEETLKLLGKADFSFNPPFPAPKTEPAKNAIDWAISEKLKSGEEGELNVTHLLLGIWAQEHSAGRRILSSLGFNDEKAEELAKTSIDVDADWNFKKKA